MSGSERSKPLIGLTTYLQRAQTGVWDVDASFLPKVYLDAVTKAGGIAVLLPPQPVDDETAHAVLADLDGLIVTGGRDVDPARYGQKAGPHTDEPITRARRLGGRPALRRDRRMTCRSSRSAAASRCST